MAERNPSPGNPHPGDGALCGDEHRPLPLQLIPLNMAAMRRENAGSAQPLAILPAVWITSAASLAVCLAACSCWKGALAEVGAASLPVLVGLILLFGYVKGVPGVRHLPSPAPKRGCAHSLKLPTLVGLLVAVSMVPGTGPAGAALRPLGAPGRKPGRLPQSCCPWPCCGPSPAAGPVRLHLGFAPALVAPTAQLARWPRCSPPPRRPLSTP